MGRTIIEGDRVAILKANQALRKIKRNASWGAYRTAEEISKKFGKNFSGKQVLGGAAALPFATGLVGGAIGATGAAIAGADAGKGFAAGAGVGFGAGLGASYSKIFKGAGKEMLDYSNNARFARKEFNKKYPVDPLSNKWRNRVANEGLDENLVGNGTRSLADLNANKSTTGRYLS